MKLYFNSHSANEESIDALISLLVLMILEVHQNDIKEFYPQIKGWTLKAADILKQHGMYKDVTRYMNKFLLSKEVEPEDVAELGAIVRQYNKDLDRDTSISKAKLDLLRACTMLMVKPTSDSSWNKVVRNVHILNNEALTAAWTDDTTLELNGLTYVEALKKIKPIVRALTGKTDSPYISRLDGPEAKEKDPEKYAQYQQYAKVLRESVKHEIRQFIRAQRQPIVSIDIVRGHLNSIGLPNTLPIGFTGGQIDEEGKMYTAEGRLLDKVVMGPVKMNPKYDPEKDNTYVLSDIEGTPSTRARTVTRNASNKALRFSQVQSFIQDEKEHRARWLQDLQKDGSEDQILAVMTELLWAISARIGGHDSRYPTENYGLTTLQVEHIKFSPSKVEFDYSGKKGTNQYAVFKIKTATDKKVAMILKGLVQGKPVGSMVFRYRGHNIIPNLVRQYIKGLGIDLNPHGFRRITGTRMATQFIAGSKFKRENNPSQAEVERWFLTEATKIAAILHHVTGENLNPKMSIKAYIDEGVTKAFFESLGLRAKDSWWGTKTSKAR